MGARFAVAAALIVSLCAVAATAAPAARGQNPSGPVECATTRWVGTWTADPSGLVGSGFNSQTVRIILTPHVGAGLLRVHLSNRFGPKPVTFTRASVALRQSGASLVAGSSRPLTFGGRANLTVPAGGEAVSDPAPLSFGAFQDLAVSLYLADPTGPATGHYIARERSYTTARSSGDHTADEGSGAFVNTVTTTAYVDAVDASVSSGIGAAAVFGDSITDGYESGGAAEDQAGIDLNHRFPDYLARRLLAQPGGPRLSVVNAGISGNRLLADGQQGLAGTSGLSRLDSDVLGVSGVTDAIVLEGINDIALQASVDQVTAALRQVVARLHARGLRVLLGTLTPAGTGLLSLGSLLPIIFIDDAANGTRVAVNGWIRSGGSGADGVIDFDAAIRGPIIGNELDASLDSGDHVHPSFRGYQRMADAVDLQSLRGARCAPPAPRTAPRLRVRAQVRSARRLHVSGRLTGAGDCSGTRVTVRALHGGRTLFKRRLRVTPACRFATTRSIAGRGRIEVRVSFAGSDTLLPAKARSVFVRAR